MQENDQLQLDTAPQYRNIGYIVLPPGHGKSFHHNSIVGLVEADSIYDCRGDAELSKLRSIARKMDDWHNYDVAWASRISARLTLHRWVVMVPNESIGRLMGGTYMGSAVLERDQWTTNLERRGKTPDDYSYCIDGLIINRTFSTNEGLSSWLKFVVNCWLAF